MKLWTLFAGLAIAGMLASGAYAQGKGGKKGGGMTPPPTFDELAAAGDVTGTGDAATVNQDQYVKYVVSKLPADAPDQAKTAAPDRAKAAFGRIVVAAALTPPVAADAVTGTTPALTKAQYTAGVAALPARGGKGKGKKGGGGA